MPACARARHPRTRSGRRRNVAVLARPAELRRWHFTVRSRSRLPRRSASGTVRTCQRWDGCLRGRPMASSVADNRGRRWGRASREWSGAGRPGPTSRGDLDDLLGLRPVFRTRMHGYDRLQVDNYAAWAESELATVRRQVDHLLGRFGDCSAELEISRRLLADAPRGREVFPGLRPGAGDAAAGRRRGRRADRGRRGGGRADRSPRRAPRPTPGCARPTRSRRWRSRRRRAAGAGPPRAGRGHRAARAGAAARRRSCSARRRSSASGSPPRRRGSATGSPRRPRPGWPSCRPRWTTCGASGTRPGSRCAG